MIRRAAHFRDASRSHTTEAKSSRLRRDDDGDSHDSLIVTTYVDEGFVKWNPHLDHP
jgi:hypothetical protein